MRLTRIYLDQNLNVGSQIELSREATRHLVTVLRAKAGDKVILFNGQGGEYAATLVTTGSKNSTVQIESFEQTERESPLKIHLGIGISRGDRFDHVIQKATELGVSEVSPLYTERTEVRLKGDRVEKKLNHWRQIAISACEQCQRNTVPPIHPPQNLSQWLTDIDCEQKFVLHHRSDHALSVNTPPPNSVALLVGPEGGLANLEIDQANEADFQHLTLGPRVLRTETAPLVALSVLQFVWGDI